jgi:ParB family transcriptional regulator, chromosome partitioning protein
MLKLESIAIEKLIPYARNSRTHSDEQVAQIAASIKEFGFTNPVLIDNEDGIIAGHGRVMAARKLGLKDIPCLRLGHLSETQKRAYVIADNKLALNSGWDGEMLKLELHELDGNINLSLLGFTVPELTIAMGFGADFEPGTEDDQGKLDQKDPIICPACSHEFHK